jgi:hypothetical protein
MGRGSSNGFSNLNPVYAQLKGLKKGETAHIQFKTRDPEDETKFIDEGHESGISGKLVGVVDKSYKHEDNEVAQGQLILEDEEEGEVYFFSFGISMVGVNIINSIAGCNEPGVIDISVWNDKETGYAKVFVRNNGEKTEWAYDWKDELSTKIKYTETTKRGKPFTERDDWELKQFMLKDVLMTEIAEKLPKREKAEGPVVAQQESATQQETPPSEEEDDKLPF